MYKAEGIKYKAIRRIKKVIDFNIPYYRQLLINMHTALADAKQKKIRFIKVDECVFTFSTFRKRSWSHSYESVSVFDQKITVKAHALIAGISEEKGLETYFIC
jgi:hypothetical protein